MERTIITVAVTGSLTTRVQNPHLPVTPEELAESVAESCQAGAAVVHLHVRDPITGKPVQDVSLFKKTIGLIRKKCNIIVNVTTGGGPGMSLEERIGVVSSLSVDQSVKPEMASLNAGSLNFGFFDREQRKFILDDVQMNPWSGILHFADTMKAHGIKPEIEIYDAGMIHNAIFLREIGAMKTPLHFQFVLGVLGGMQPTVENLVFLKNAIPSGSTWGLCAVGLNIFSLGPVAIALGGNVRVGFEDCIYISKGNLAQSNAQMVRKIAALSREMGREVATCREARALLNLSEFLD
ncbi:MAG: 3-keto-5-aminohexanoate cleavage protein [Deltaproteobacteria bacterium]|nr:3-keto-5-aminohexanoate cleavage protein [Deltaproteobacteria bacterium]